ncbi:THUMP domain protein [Penicillium lagena]|uniref:THUMP domain protein n=1 Tax=Penicillium lagena TaxID=94218 RepID=UPI00253FCD7B|nr:THUMP domain protein [Penicillium lagena]KAJ5601653.1 THUMP domain protein [Penicillium lagena]
MVGGKHNMPDRSSQSGKGKKGGRKYQQSKGPSLESGDWGVFVTCDIGKEGKCIAETQDVFSQYMEATAPPAENEDTDSDDGDIEAQIRKELEGLKPSAAKPRSMQPIRFDMPCVTFMRLDKSIDPVQLVHRLCTEAQANPTTKTSRWIQRMTPVTEIRKTLRVDLEAFAKEILAPHFHSGGPPKKYAIRPTIRGNDKFGRDVVIKTIADVVGKEHPVDLTNYDLVILVTVLQNVIGMSVVGSDYDQLKRYNLAEIYAPTPKPKSGES